MNNYTNSTPFVKGLVTLGMLMAAVTTNSFAVTAVQASKSFDDLEMQAPTSLKAATPGLLVNGTGTVQFKFSFTIDNGCCMRVKADLMRQPLIIGKVPTIGLPGQTQTAAPPTAVASKTFELCGSQAGNIMATSVNADQNGFLYFMQFSNPDTWDRAHVVIDHISVLYPTGVLQLSTDPTTALTLLQGQDQDRPFTVPDGKAGKLNISLNWTGGGRLKLEVFKPGAATPIQTVTSSTGTLTVPEITVTTNDDGDWKLVYTNTSSSNTPANSISTAINMTVIE